MAISTAPCRTGAGWSKPCPRHRWPSGIQQSSDVARAASRRTLARFSAVMRVKAVVRAPGSNSAMSLHRFVLLLVCLLLPIRSVGAAVIVLGSDVNAGPVATHSTCIASVVLEHAVENADGAASDVQRSGSNHALDPTCASLCAMVAAPPVVARYVTEPASLRLPGPTLSFQHFFAPPPHEPPRPTA